MPGADFNLGLAVADASVVVRWVMPERGAAEALEGLANVASRLSEIARRRWVRTFLVPSGQPKP